MKKIKLFFAVAILCAASAVGYNAYTNATMTEEERFFLANLDALSDVEVDIDTSAKCRCKDGGCYGGNAISVRPACATTLLNNCSQNDVNCN